MVTRVKWFEPNYVDPVPARWFSAGQQRDAAKHLYAEHLYAKAVEHEQHGHASCVDWFFQVALATCAHDRQSCQSCFQRDLHKSALMKLVVTGQRFNRLDPQSGLQIVRDGHAERIPISYHGFVWKAADFQFLTPVGEYRTNAVRNLHRRSGVGVPLVVSRCGRIDGSFLPDRSVFAATLRMGCAGNSVGGQRDCPTPCRLEMYDPLRVDQAATTDGPQIIAKDLSAPMAYRLRDQRRTILNDFIDPDAARGENRLYLTEPYQPGKIPIVFIHGLLSDPFTWVEMVNEPVIAASHRSGSGGRNG
ncbi:hypothetical protein Enr13x_78410 [Stieleria neptunia]|uniref:Alpha/beta hydrolase family protein n=2 Tax=Stieleria neptunia TaxID=2527979 RepID=A0A518I4A2_9BACT|nr:hypothetical protein Enr13x_78410 [Stieleria neptunia]